MTVSVCDSLGLSVGRTRSAPFFIEKFFKILKVPHFVPKPMKDFPGLIVIVKNRMRKHHGINICKNLHYNIKGDWKIIHV